MKSLKPITFLLLVLAVFGITATSLAYVELGPEWATNTPTYDQHTLGSAWKTAVWNGATRWNNVTSSPFAWSRTDSSVNQNDVFRGSIDGSGGTLAVTTVTSLFGLITWINMEFDTAESWYTGTGTPGASQFDAYSVAAHEFGHALGLDHTNLSCSGSTSTRPTMCATYSAGQTYARSLHSDDQNGLNAIYP